VAQIIHQYVDAAAGQRQHDRASDAAPAAGDERELAPQLVLGQARPALASGRATR